MINNSNIIIPKIEITHCSFPGQRKRTAAQMYNNYCLKLYTLKSVDVVQAINSTHDSDECNVQDSYLPRGKFTAT